MALKPSHKDELKNKLYRNWVKAGLSLKYLKDGIGDFADECAKSELDRILQKLGLPTGSSCNQCSLATLRPAHVSPPKVKHCPIGQRHCNCLQNKTTSCPNNICGRIFDEIVDSHGTRCPNWKNTDITKWTTNPWEIAKCFINAPGYEATRSASDTDISGLLQLFINSTGFQGHMLCAISLFDKMKTWRNSLFHSPKMELEDQQLTDGINDIITILNDGKELKDKECSKQAIHKLSKLPLENFVIITETEAEVCQAALASITKLTQELKSIQEEAKRDIILKTDEVKESIMLKQEEAEKSIVLKHEEAKKTISLKQEEAIKTVQDAAATCNSQLHREVSELRDTIKTHEIEIKSHEIDIKSLNVRVNEVEQAVENLKKFEDNTTEHLKKMENIIALKRKLKERYRTYYIKTSQSPLKTTENIIEISQVYVPPNMKKVTEITTETGEKKEHTVQIMDYSEICLTEGKPNKRIYILGDVGSGKSAFCKMMMRNWCLSSEDQYEEVEEDMRTLGQFELLFYLPLCTFHDEDSLLDMITWYYGDICTKDDLINIIQLKCERCLVLADGIDEWKPTKVGRRRAHETRGLPTTDKMDHVTIVMTSRPSAEGILNLEKSNYDVKVRLDGIRDVKTFIEKLYPKSQPEDILRKLRDVPIKNLEKTPFLLQQIVWLQQQNIDIGTSISEVYSNVVNIAFRWNQKDTEKAMVGHTLRVSSKFTELTFPDQIKNSFPEFISHSSVIFGLGKMAFEIMTQGSQLSFGSFELNKNGIDENLRTLMLGTGLLTEEVRFDNSKENTQFYFTHTSFLEYFAALFIASHREEDKTLGSDSCTCHKSIFDNVMERCHSIQDVIPLENMLVIICGLAPSLTYNVCMLMYESLKQSHIYEQKEICLPNYSLNWLSIQCRDLAYRCIRECKLNDPQIPLKLPYFAVCFGDKWPEEPEKTTEVMQHVDPLTVRCCTCLKYNPLLNLYVFQNLQILKISCNFQDPTDNKLSSLAEYITQTVTLRYIILKDEIWPWDDSENDILLSMIYTIDLSKHDQLQSLVFDGFFNSVKRIRANGINTLNLHHCIIRGTTCSLFSTYAEKLNDLELTDLKLKHDELSDWIKLINGSVLLKTIKISYVRCSDHREGCSHVLELLHHNQLQTLVISNRIENARLYLQNVSTLNLKNDSPLYLNLKNVSTLNLKKIDLDISVVSLSLTDTPNHCEEFSLYFTSLKHDGLSDLKQFIARSVSMGELYLMGIRCLDHDNCSHKIDLSQCTQLEKLHVHKPFSCDKINTSNLKHCSTDNTEVLHCLRDSLNLHILRLDCLSYSKDVHDCVLTLPKLQYLILWKMNIEDGALVMIPQMKCLRMIQMDDVNMSESSCLQFLESLLTLKQSVECEVYYEWESSTEQYINNYVSVNKDKFRVRYCLYKLYFRALKEHAKY